MPHLSTLNVSIYCEKIAMPLSSRDLLIFEAVVSNGSIQGAANAIGLTQSAVSRVVQRLEADLGRSLLDRTQRPIRLTRDGERAIHHARTVLAALDHMEDAFRVNTLPSGPFRLGIPHALIGVLVDTSSMLGLNGFPDIRPMITSGWSDELLTKLARHELDAVLTLTRSETLPENADPLSINPLQVVAAGEHESDARDLDTANAIGWALNPEGCGYRRALMIALERHGQTPNIVLETNSLELQLQFVKAGRALTLAPGFLGKISEAASGLSFVEAKGLKASIAILLHHPPGAQTFAPVLREIRAHIKGALTDNSDLE